MSHYKELFKAYLDQKGTRYTENDECIRIGYSTDNANVVEVSCIFDKDDGNTVTFYCWKIGEFPKEQFGKVLVTCNKMNNKYRWMRFFVDKDNAVVVQSDAYLNDATCGSECSEYVTRIVNLVDELYPEFMRVRWT